MIFLWLKGYLAECCLISKYLWIFQNFFSFSFEKIVVIGNYKNNTEKYYVAFTQFFPMGTAYMTVIITKQGNWRWYNSQVSDFHSFKCGCVWIFLCNLMTCVDQCNHHHNQDEKLSYCYKVASCHTFIVVPIPSPSPIHDACQPLICSPSLYYHLKNVI